VQFFKGLQADSTKACWSMPKAFYQTAVREPMAAMLDELSRESRQDRRGQRVTRAGRWPA
jgi:hypothetical protein